MANIMSALLTQEPEEVPLDTADSEPAVYVPHPRDVHAVLWRMKEVFLVHESFKPLRPAIILHIPGRLPILNSKPESISMASPQSTNMQDVPDSPTLRRNSSVASLAQMAETACLKNLTAAVAGKQSPTGYCCGGYVTLCSSPSTESGRDSQLPAQPILTLRWDDLVDDSISRKIRFPRILETGQDSVNITKDTQALIDAYGASGVVEGASFAVGFDLSTHGILDTVAQALLPGADCDLLKDRPEHRGVMTTNRTLQIRTVNSPQAHSLPSSTPSEYLGKLLVFLPCPHEGGQLEVSTDDDQTTFEFGTAYRNSLHWVAFTSNSKYSLAPVQDGCQLVLTYDLIIDERIGGAIKRSEDISRSPSADPTFFPLYRKLQDMLLNPGFFKKEGGRIGYYCQHAYSHTSPNTNALMPYALRGTDLILYNVFISLGLTTQVRPVLNPEDYEQIGRFEYVTGKAACMENLDMMAETAEMWLHLPQDTITDEELENFEYPGYEEWLARTGMVVAGTRFHGFRYEKMGKGELETEDIKSRILLSNWDWTAPQIEWWLNEPKIDGKKSKELAILNAYTKSKKRQKWELYHSLVAIWAWVPKAEERELRTV
ncbi:hypothetical protein DL98DRAFT_572812 [Cadophora sp. DSE1049]|nr:hypothetical protein DL98DRAFT_572812 [Cadophora sp. DSE1049]